MQYYIRSIAVLLTAVSILLIGCKANKETETVSIETTVTITESTETKSMEETVPEFDTVVMFEDIQNVSEAVTEVATITDEHVLNNDFAEKKMESEIVVDNSEERIQDSDTIEQYLLISGMENMGDLIP